MKIYTKTGDAGKTSLLGGTRVDKDDYRLEAYGTIDELNACLGLLISKINGFDEITFLLQHIQNQLFIIGSHLACPDAVTISLPILPQSEIEKLELAIDAYTEEITPLKNFILPGGHEYSATTQLCRTVCRRAERRVVCISKINENLNPIYIRYLNRLSDFLFVLARKFNFDMKVEEVIWKPTKE